MELTPNEKSLAQEHVKVLILGSGPAGLAAALYTARAQLEPVVLAGQEYGGQVSLTHTVENYPGFPDAVGGPELTELFRKQAEHFGAKTVFDTAVKVDLSQRPFKVTSFATEYTADTLIIATGATPRHLEVPGETEFTGRGVSYCGTCDGFFFKEKDIVVVGGGDSAMEEGAFLTRFANNVTVIHRRDDFRAGDLLLQRAKDNPKMSFITNTVVNKIEGNGTVQTIELEDVVTGEKKPFTTDGIFIFIGHTPNTQLFEGQLEMDEGGYLVANRYMETSVPGVFAAGEVADPHFRQVITSAGMGAGAGIQATRFLEANE
ncbi:MAG TPA: thioredoxin-disulfide reductase [Anaerolineales bacterium]|nr:thioredoxin-disulfide reductase [Anaerolineales bacterium]HRQ91331.1 thioredoxin-disulfide reductase [Anaerolineales bacterium]